MQSNNFADSYNWNQPEHLEKALNILNCPIVGAKCSCSTPTDDYHEVKALLASNPDTPADVLDHISQCTSHAGVLERIAENPNAPKETLKRLAEHDDDNVRGAVTENNNIDEEIVLRLARDGHVDVRFRLAENHNIEVEVLEILSNDENPYVAYRAQMTRQRVEGQSKQAEELPVRTWKEDNRRKRAF